MIGWRRARRRESPPADQPSDSASVGRDAGREAGDPDATALDELQRAFASGAAAVEPPPPVEPPPQAPDPPNEASPVITITDEDLPDAVYIEGTLDPSSASSQGAPIVFIEDDDTGDAIVPLGSDAIGSATIEPRLRDRRIAVRRAEGRRRLRWALIVGLVVIVVVGVLAVLGSPLFSVDRDAIAVTGNVYADPVRLEEILDDLAGTPTLLVDTERISQEIEAIPWVAEARVRTHFPSAASIEIRERSPLATYQGADGRFRVIDREGRVLDVLDGQPIAYMLLTGPDSLNLQPGQFTPPGHAAAAELVQALTPTVRGRVDSIEVTGDASDLRMFLDDGVEVRFGAATDLLVKLVRLETVLPSAAERGFAVLDVSTAQVTVR